MQSSMEIISPKVPDPQVFLMGAEATGAQPSECVVFEDAVAGVQAAKAGGMKAVGIGSADILTEADIVISTFEDFSVEKLTQI
jgi:beta-phosphoglucomutase